MATIPGLNHLSTPRLVAVQKPCHYSPMRPAWLNLNQNQNQNQAWKRVPSGRIRAAPDSISEKVEKSIKEAEEACQGDPASGECVAAWDEVEELSAAASHARDKKKDSDPLETYCKDNPETDECRTYDN